MKTLQEAFDQELKDLFKPENLGTELVRKKFKELGVEITKSQLSKIKRQFAHPKNDVFHFEFEDDQVFNAGFESKEQFESALKNIFNELTTDLEDYSNNFFEELPSIVMESTDKLSKEILNDLKKDSKRMLKERAADYFSFEANLYSVYSEAFDLLEMLIAISLEAGESFNNDLRKESSSNNDYVFEVLTRLHARACQIAYEILILLKSGLADGAHARWRSLHEISVTAFFISTYGNDIAERYLLHDEIESYKAAKIYQENCAFLGYEPLSEEEIAELEDIHDELLRRFGKNYRFDYGWASVVTKMDRSTFRDIEKSAGLKHLRPYYKMACHNVHANPRGLFFKLGLYPESGDILLAGPSNVGLTDPGQLTALSLAQISTTLLTHQPNIDRLTACKIMRTLEREIGQAFSDAENSIKEKIEYNNGVE
jgi:hypothetical protein